MNRTLRGLLRAGLAITWLLCVAALATGLTLLTLTDGDAETRRRVGDAFIFWLFLGLAGWLFLGDGQ